MHYEDWERDPDESAFNGYVDGPFNQKDVKVYTMAEAKGYLKKFKSEHPKAIKMAISYDADEGELIGAYYYIDAEEIQHCIDVFKYHDYE